MPPEARKYFEQLNKQFDEYGQTGDKSVFDKPRFDKPSVTNAPTAAGNGKPPVVPLPPAAWMGLFTDDPATLQAGAAYLRIVGPAYGFFGLGLLLYFASQGARRMGWSIGSWQTSSADAATTMQHVFQHREQVVYFLRDDVASVPAGVAHSRRRPLLAGKTAESICVCAGAAGDGGARDRAPAPDPRQPDGRRGRGRHEDRREPVARGGRGDAGPGGGRALGHPPP